MVAQRTLRGLGFVLRLAVGVDKLRLELFETDGDLFRKLLVALDSPLAVRLQRFLLAAGSYPVVQHFSDCPVDAP